MSLFSAVLNALIFSAIAVMAFTLSVLVVDKITPVDLWEEIVKKQNIAVAILSGAIAIAIGSIVAAAVHG